MNEINYITYWFLKAIIDRNFLWIIISNDIHVFYGKQTTLKSSKLLKWPIVLLWKWTQEGALRVTQYDTDKVIIYSVLDCILQVTSQIAEVNQEETSILSTLEPSVYWNCHYNDVMTDYACNCTLFELHLTLVNQSQRYKWTVKYYSFELEV